MLSTAQMIEHWDALRAHQVSLKRTPSILLGIEDGLGWPVSVHLLLPKPRGRGHIDDEWHLWEVLRQDSHCAFGWANLQM
jgi:hypothetical protein